jgi:hypothetical protein
VNRRFSIWTGLDGFMLANLSCGMEPTFSVGEALTQVALMVTQGRCLCTMI